MSSRGSLDPKTDVAKLLILTGPATQLLLALFVITQTVLFLSTAGDVARPWVSAFALILVNSVAVLITRPGPYPLKLNHALASVAVVAMSTALVSWELPTSGWPGYASWHLGANTFLLLGLGLRGRSGWAWVGMAGMVGVTILWTASTGRGLLTGVDLVDRQAGTLLIGTIFAIGLSRTAQRIDDFNATESRRAAEHAALQAGSEERVKQILRLGSDARPVLELIASPAPVALTQRREFLILEATLRDDIRARSLAREPLTAVAKNARRRGIGVLLLDDSEPESYSDDQQIWIASWVASHLREMNRGTLTARVLPLGRSAVASIVIDSGEASRHFELRSSMQTIEIGSDLGRFEERLTL
jgi:hypothetical protein